MPNEQDDGRLHERTLAREAIGDRDNSVVTEAASRRVAARMRECAGMSLGYTLHGSRYARLSEKDAVTRPALGNALQLVLPAAVCPDRLAP